jgi:hypothetical protein
MFSQSTSSNFSEAIIAAQRFEKQFLKNEYLTNDRDRNKIRLNFDRYKETFLQLTRKRHETWYRHDKYFREALKKEKDRHEKYFREALKKEKDRHDKYFREALKKEKDRHEKCHGSAKTVDNIILPSLITLNSRPEPMTKVEQRTHQILNVSQKFLDKSAARSTTNLSCNRPSSSPNRQKSCSTTTRSSCTYNSASLIVPMTQSIDFVEYNRLMNESLKRETYADFVDHFVKFRPEFREHFAHFHQTDKRQNAVKKLRELIKHMRKQKINVMII